eukprot:scaffold230709_cov23-Cyclotella_meneghiniana.AAC.1
MGKNVVVMMNPKLLVGYHYYPHALSREGDNALVVSPTLREETLLTLAALSLRGRCDSREGERGADNDEGGCWYDDGCCVPG